MSDNRPHARYKSRPESSSRRQQRQDAREKSSNSINNLLAYYESTSAGAPPSQRATSTDSTSSSVSASRPTRQRALSVGSTSSSDYSEASDSVDEPFSDLDGSVTSAAKRRSNIPSLGGSDRRRLAIVQMETLQEAMASDTNSSASSIRSRRGLSTQLAGLALVAPPDASSKTYTHLTPPTSTTARPRKEDTYRLGQGEQSPRSEKASSRDIGTDDTETDNKNRDRVPLTNKHIPRTHSLLSPATRPLEPTPKPSPYETQRAMLSPVSRLDRHNSSAQTSGFPTPLITPEIGASKEIHVPVAAPVVVNLASKDAVQPRRTTSAQRSPVDPASHVDTSATPSTAFDPIQTSGFVHYQPGLHATAGPLPPPPRLFDINLRTPPPPRPPRLHSPAPPKMKSDLEAMKQSLQLPPSVTAKLAKTSPPPPDNIKASTVPSKHEEEVSGGEVASATLQSPLSSHRREGAFPSSPLVRSPDSLPRSTPSLRSAQIELEVNEAGRLSPIDDNDVPDVTIEEEAAEAAEDSACAAPAAEQGQASREEDSLKASTSTTSSSYSRKSRGSMKGDRSSWISAGSLGLERTRTPSPQSNYGRHGISLEDTGISPKGLSRSLSLSPRSSNNAPSPPPKSFRNSLTTGLKRFSTLSAKSARRSSSSTHETNESLRTPSPPGTTHTKNVHRKILDYNPPAMFCHEVYQQRTTAERCAIYVAKINELYIYDCGLSDWVIEMKYRTSNPPPRGPSAQAFVPKPRMTSRSSMISEATFPRRPDAVTATDLSAQSPSFGDASPISVPVSLPYQSLANQQRQQSIRSTSSAASGTPPSSVRSLVSSSTSHSSRPGFFASLGRKASLNTTSRRERHGPGLTLAHSNGNRTVLSKSPPLKQEISKPILISSNHSAPSGPRALTSSMRVQRSQTLMTPVYPNLEREGVIGRRPSLFNIPSQQDVSAAYIPPDSEFEAQVNKLHNLIPNADRLVLAGYLRRAGQDVLAIGQYLEDEKNGTLKYF